MFSIIISEKGGAERRETFDKNEINVGRVQGNDLMLPKGNVSKHHARLLYRDGRFIVTDLKSTNGTYVNGRKIAQATIVREGDKIYIGDFVLRLDAGAASEQQPAPDDESVRTLARGGSGDRNERTANANANANANASAGHAAQPQIPPAPAMPQIPPQPRAPQPMMGGAAPAYDREPEEEVAPPPKPAPAPRPQGAAGGGAARGGTLNLSGNAARAPQPGAGIARSASVAAGPAPAPQPIVAPTPPAAAVQQAPAPVAPIAATSPAAQVPANLGPAVLLPVAPPRVVPRETAAQAGRRLALITLVDRIADAIDLASLKTSPAVDDALGQQIERTARDQAALMREEGEVPEGIDLDQLVGDAQRELTALGPLARLLEDDEVVEIQCVRNDQVLAVRGAQITLADASFTSDEALSRAITRLAHQSGEPRRDGETIIERRLPRGAHLLAIAPPAAASHALVIRKRRKVDTTLEDLVRAGAMSRPMAVFLDACVQARANVLATAPRGTSTAAIVAALASAAPPGERIALLSDVEEVQIAQALVFSLSIADRRPSACEEVVRAGARLHPDRLIVSSLPTGTTAPLLEAIAEGAEGVIAAGTSPSLRALLARFASQLVLSRPGLDVESARDTVSDAFDVAIEMSTMADGRARVVRISELGSGDARQARDLFTFSPDGDGSFNATGIVPRLTNDFATRGVKLDAGLFKRGR